LEITQRPNSSYLPPLAAPRVLPISAFSAAIAAAFLEPYVPLAAAP
jgi:hypothetical protein